MNKPFEGLFVVELTSYWAATTAGRFLRSMGARVIKVETPPKGDPTRFTGRAYAMPITNEENPLHDIINGGKECIGLDLRQPENMKIMHNMLAKADVFVTSTRIDGLKKLGLDYDTLKEMYPSLVMAHVTGYGLEGPMSKQAGIDAISFFGKNGVLTDLRMDPDSPPIYSPTGMGDLTTGTMLTVGIASALYKREKTGKGDYVMTSLYGAGNWVTGPVSVGTQYGYQWPRSVYTASAMGQAYRTKDDKFVFLFVNEYDKFYDCFCKAFGLEDVHDDPRFCNFVATLVPENRKALCTLTAERARLKTAQEIMDVLQAGDVPSTILSKFKDKYEDPDQLEQCVSNGYLAPHTYEASGKTVYLNQMPIYFDSVGVENMYERNHDVGEDNVALFKEFGD